MKRMKALPILSASFFLVLSLGASLIVANQDYEKAEAYKTSSKLTSTIDLNPTSESAIRSYYSSLSNGDKTGTNLLKELKNILKTGQKYYSYDGSDNKNAIWQMYEIIDRDWVKSPAEDIDGYDSETKIITGYTYGTNASHPNDPYVHALYVNRNVNNQTTAWSTHQQTDAWGINQEHVWPKSHGFDTKGSDSSGGARGDPMHLWAGNGYANNIHSNNYYGYVDTTKSYTDCGTKFSNVSHNLLGTSKTMKSGTVFEPQDSDKGDIARAVFYMAARYNYLAEDDDTIDGNNPNLKLDNNINLNTGTSSTTTPFSLGVLSDLLEWHHLDPVDAYEIKRNDILYTNYTFNRNPFIDYPDWVDLIWGDKVGEGYASPSTDTIHAFGEAAADVVVTGVSLQKTGSVAVGETITLTPSIEPSNATNKEVTWSTSNANIATVSNGVVTGVAEGNATITVTTEDGHFSNKCNVTVTAEALVKGIVTDTLNKALTGSPSSYTDWDNKQSISNAVYAGNSSGDYNTIQIRKTNSNSGVVTTSSGGRIRKISVDWNTNNSDGRKIDIYGKNAAYSGPSDLFDAEKQGTKLGSITYNTSTSLTVDSDYNYIGIRSNEGTAYLNEILLDWEVPVTGVSIDESVTIDLNDDPEFELTSSISPSNAFDKAVSWVSSDDEVATVDTNGVVTGLRVGTATITVTTHDGSFTDTCEVTVIDTTEPEQPEGDFSVDKMMSDIATDNSWTTSSGNNVYCYTSFDLDSHIHVSTSGKANCGSYWSDSKWRLYQTQSGDITITAEEGYKINSVIITYTVSSTGILKDESSESVLSNAEYEVDDGSSVTFTVGNSGSALNGQVRISEIYVSYSTVSVVPGEDAFDPIAPDPSFPYFIGVAYKMYLTKESINYYFTGSLSAENDYTGLTSSNYSDGVYVYFDSNHYLYTKSGETKTYITMRQDGSYYDFTYSTTTPSTGWKYSDDYGCIYWTFGSVDWTIGNYNRNTFQSQNLTKYNSTALKPQFAETAETYSYKFLNNVHCDNSGVIAPKFATGYAWIELKTKYEALDSSEQTKLTNANPLTDLTYVGQAAERYDLIAKKYSLNNFMNRNSANPASTINVLEEYSSNSTIYIILVFAGASLVSILGLVLLKKKR